jgi:porin
MKKSFLLATYLMTATVLAPAVYADDAQEPAAPRQEHGNLLVNGPTGGIWQQDQMLGDAWGARKWLAQYGVSVNLQEVSEILGNTSGGVKRTGDYDGLTTLTMQVDTSKAFGWDGGTFNASGLDVHGTNLSANNLQN